MFRVHDPSVDPDGPGSPVPNGSLISTNREQMIVACAQEHVNVQLTIEEGEDAPPPFSDGYEDEAKCTLYLRGRLSINDPRRSGGVGDYGVHVYTRNRPEALRRYAALFEMDVDPLGDEFQQARKRLEGLEQYLLQLWRES